MLKMTRNTEKPFVSALLLFTTLSLLPSSLSQYDIAHSNTTVCTNSSNASAEYAQCLDDIPIYDSCPDPSLCEPSDGKNVGLAFGLTIGAGLATTLGALLPFIPLIKRSNTTFLAIGLALAAGVMLYVSFTEIFKKSRDNFCCNTPSHYEVAATGCFFAGILLTGLLDLLVGLLQRIDCGCGCMSRCSRQHESQDLDSKDETRHSKLKEKSLRNTKPRINGVNGLHCEFDFMHYHSEEGHTPMMSSSNSEITSTSTPTADSLEEGEEPGAVVAVETHNSETESGADPIQNCSSQRALLSNNNTDSASNSNGNVPLNRTGSVSVSDTESRRYAAVTPDGVSTTFSENTNNYANASVNELFSNSSLLRMNAVIPPETVSENASAVSAVGGEEMGVVMADAQSHVSVAVEEEGGVSGGDGEACDGGEAEVKTVPSKLLRRLSYSEMVEQKHDDIQPMGPEEFKEVTMVMGKDARKLHRMGILTGLAIGIHNFPEGLATFVAALSSPSLGIALAIAIALHNIPEGVCVSMPVYYATGKKWKGFLWAFLSGISEPFGALLGWLVFKDIFGPLVYGCLFGLIAGMMVFISLKELIPTAHKFDRRGLLVAVFLVMGMVIMAASLLLFLY